MAQAGIDVEKAKQLDLGQDEFPYNHKDIILYNLGLGAKRNELDLVYENDENFQVLPTFGVIPSINALSSLPLGDILPNFNPMMFLHGEQYIELHKSYGTGGKLTTSSKIIDILDKGKGAVVIVGTTSKDESGDVVCYNEVTIFVRGSGGFGGRKEGADRGAATAANEPPKRAPDAVVREKTTEEQAAIYRLSGDYNPLHIDPSMSAIGGFEVPILHGLCTFGYTSRHVFRQYANSDINNIKSIKGRFSSHVFPGETLETQMWLEGNKVIFQTKVVERGVIVITNGAVELKGAPAPSAGADAKTESAGLSVEGFESSALFEQIAKAIAAASPEERQAQAKKVKAIFQFDVTNAAGKTQSWHIDLKSGDGQLGLGPSEKKPDVILQLKDADLVQIATGKLNGQKAFMQGKLKIKGQIMLATKLGDVLNTNRSRL
ncbi:uncharacterized protein VTP21DRAFT_3029 [Calcarisporiella thermophila]|uniref:uncharacterized protein n=1 Tax=Calcarisporiella thermophila TaxID=911321 RepID=UPI0037421E35